VKRGRQQTSWASPDKRRLLVHAAVLGAILAYSWTRRRDLGRFLENVRRYSAPDAAIYDAVTAPLLDGFFGQVAGKVAGFAPGGRVLEVGSGPGRLAVRIAELDPDVRIAGVDLAPEMVERAEALAARSGVADRVAFRVGDVASLPFAEASFDAAVSTFSLHHWPEPARGLAEVYRVLRPGGVAVIYDLAGWIRRLQRGAPPPASSLRAVPSDGAASADKAPPPRATARSEWKANSPKFTYTAFSAVGA
jgi:SAM-dependent methyltransferase